MTYIGANAATAIATQFGVTTVIAEVLPGDKATKVAELMAAEYTVAMVGDGVNGAVALARTEVAIGIAVAVAVESADVVLMRSDPRDVAVALCIGRGTAHKMRQNLGWAIGYNRIALPITAGVVRIDPMTAAITMVGSSILVAVNAHTLKRLHLPTPTVPERRPQAPVDGAATMPAVRACRPTGDDLPGRPSHAHTPTDGVTQHQP